MKYIHKIVGSVAGRIVLVVVLVVVFGSFVFLAYSLLRRGSMESPLELPSITEEKIVEEEYQGNLENIYRNIIAVKNYKEDLFEKPERCVISVDTEILSIDNEVITKDSLELGDIVNVTTLIDSSSEDDVIRECKVIRVVEKYDEEAFIQDIQPVENEQEDK